tara:strand:- start:963 stop:1103 length:141 start_codon:yes stop_codon:yes gene_type:complete
MKKETYQKMLEEAQNDVHFYNDKLEQAKFKLRALLDYDKQELQELT